MKMHLSLYGFSFEEHFIYLRDWPSFVGPLVQAYNATRHDSTGFSPHYLMFGWHPQLSVDAFFGRDGDDDDHEPDTYVNRLK